MGVERERGGHNRGVAAEAGLGFKALDFAAEGHGEGSGSAVEAAGSVGKGIEGAEVVKAGLVEGAVGPLPEIALADVAGAEGPVEGRLLRGGAVGDRKPEAGGGAGEHVGVGTGVEGVVEVPGEDLGVGGGGEGASHLAGALGVDNFGVAPGADFGADESGRRGEGFGGPPGGGAEVLLGGPGERGKGDGGGGGLGARGTDRQKAGEEKKEGGEDGDAYRQQQYYRKRERSFGRAMPRY